jgi:hypothetical protein
MSYNDENPVRNTLCSRKGKKGVHKTRRERQTDRQTGTDRQEQTDRNRQTGTDRQEQTDRETDRNSETEGERGGYEKGKSFEKTHLV